LAIYTRPNKTFFEARPNKTVWNGLVGWKILPTELIYYGRADGSDTPA
jgi:hypothetical protein